MYVQEVKLEENEKSYMLLNDDGTPVLPVVKYIKYLDTTGKSYNTLKTYCYALKQYHSFLKEKKLDLCEITVSDLADYIGWLKNPYGTDKIKSIIPLLLASTFDEISANYFDEFFPVAFFQNIDCLCSSL
jgi:hypothetical protein